MANSLSLPEAQPSGSFQHRLSGTSFESRTVSGTMEQSATRGGVRAEYPIAYVMGSGNHAFAYLIRLGDFLFQSPISYYTRRGVWDMAPGFEQDREPDFTRPIGPECLLCHAGASFPAGGLNQYQTPAVGAMGISCERCHGPTQSHLQSPSRDNIVNPARLSPRARDSVCEQCHLTGEVRIPNPGRTLADFQAGQMLESAFSVYIFDTPKQSKTNEIIADERIKVVSHAEQLRRSVCARSSGGRLWCGTCHDPHNVPVDKKSFYRERCLSCHGSKLSADHPVRADDCVACHMPSRPAKDGGHTAFTDHRIMKRQGSGGDIRQSQLVAWSEPDPSIAQRNLALAYLAVGEQKDSADFIRTAGELLRRVQPAFPRDAEVLNGLGVVLMRQGRTKDSLMMVNRAVEIVPASALYRINLATTLMANGELDGAIEHLDRAIELDPSLELAYRRLVEVYGKKRDNAGVKRTFERYLKFRPQSIGARQALRVR